MTTRLTVVATLLAAALTLSGCGEDPSARNEVHTAAGGEQFNDADVEFATGMIPHHAQALQMVDLTLGRELDPAVEQLAEDVRTAQGPEIELMSDWLTDWDRPVPETSRDHSNAHGGGHGEGDGDSAPDMPGMMGEEQMTALEDAPDGEFEALWLEMMIEHHEGAIEMARTEQEQGHHPAAVDLAKDIEAAQQAEIETMRGLLGS